MLPALTKDQFVSACIAFTRKYDGQQKLNTHLAPVLGGWTWTDYPAHPALGFLTRQCTTSLFDKGIHKSDAGRDVDESDEATLSTSLSESTVIIRQYVVFSVTFQVPALYFTACRANGSPLTLDELIHTGFLSGMTIAPYMHTDFSLYLPPSNHPALSQGDHPTLGTPCWYLHPCETQSVMSELLKEATVEAPLHWLEKWFMFMSAVVDLRTDAC